MKLGAVALVLAFGAFGAFGTLGAPMQCGSSRDPDLRLEDTPGDALWDLASTFEKEGNTAARDRTLKYLVTRYPSNRHADAAKQRLAGK